MCTQELEAGHPLHTLLVDADGLQVRLPPSVNDQFLSLRGIEDKVVICTPPYQPLELVLVCSPSEMSPTSAVLSANLMTAFWVGADTVIGVQSVQKRAQHTASAGVEVEGRGEMGTLNVHRCEWKVSFGNQLQAPWFCWCSGSGGSADTYPRSPRCIPVFLLILLQHTANYGSVIREALTFCGTEGSEASRDRPTTLPESSSTIPAVPDVPPSAFNPSATTDAILGSRWCLSSSPRATGLPVQLHIREL